eukprot:TRINITY_DN8726_c0_g2_i4.p1 TRINITY_DN8726_c0_g2~~TRINITY_DN8726_c0_g2_i4.p1  ORF type:complete len:461 (-),score=91.55 TRINITY_DN8726_c0_g2_i4:350-1732(-)
MFSCTQNGHRLFQRGGQAQKQGISGVFTPSHYHWNHSELPPYSDYQLKTAYHTREFEVFKLKQLNPDKKMDIFLSHDWPAGITEHGNLQQLLKYKTFLRKEIETGEFGNPPAMELLDYLKPTHWFAAHIHTKFVALRHHKQQNGSQASCTKFLALDKCLPHRDFLQVLQIPGAKGPKRFEYDEEWLSIVHATHQHLVWHPGNLREPDELNLKQSRAFVKEVFQDLTVPKNFKQTVPLYREEKGKMPRRLVENSQTTEFLERMGLEFHVGQQQQQQSDVELLVSAVNNEEIKLTSEDDVDVPKNEEEIDLDDEFDGQKNDEELDIDMEDDDQVDDIIDVWEDEDDEDDDRDSQLDDDQLDEFIENQIHGQYEKNIEKLDKSLEVDFEQGDNKPVNLQGPSKEIVMSKWGGEIKVELEEEKESHLIDIKIEQKEIENQQSSLEQNHQVEPNSRKVDENSQNV